MWESKFFFGEVFNCQKLWCSISPIAGKYVKPSKALWFTGFNNPGNTNPISEQADVGFQGWELGADTCTTQQLTLCTRRYSNLLIVFKMTLDVNGSRITNKGKKEKHCLNLTGFLEGRMTNQRERTFKRHSRDYYLEPLGKDWPSCNHTYWPHYILYIPIYTYIYIYTKTKYIHVYNHTHQCVVCDRQAIIRAPHCGLIADELGLGLFEEASASAEPANRTRSELNSPLLWVQWPLKFIHLCFKSSFSSWSHLKWLKSVEVSALTTERHIASRQRPNSALHMENSNQFLEWTGGRGSGCGMAPSYKKRNPISINYET